MIYLLEISSNYKHCNDLNFKQYDRFTLSYTEAAEHNFRYVVPYSIPENAVEMLLLTGESNENQIYGSSSTILVKNLNAPMFVCSFRDADPSIFPTKIVYTHWLTANEGYKSTLLLGLYYSRTEYDCLIGIYLKYKN